MKRSLDEPRQKGFWRDLLAEFFGTFMLMTVQSAVPLHWRTVPDEPHPLDVGNVVQVALAMGFIVSTMAWTFGEFGGAHLNPAVTVSMMVSGKVGFIRGRKLLNTVTGSLGR